MADPAGGRIGPANVDREVLRGIEIDEGDRRVEVRRDCDPAMAGEGPSQDFASLQPRQKHIDLALDRVGQSTAGRDQDRRRVCTVLGLGDQVRGDEDRIGRIVGKDHPLRWAGRQVDPDESGDLQLGGGHPGVARPDDPVDGGQPRLGIGQTEGEGADRLGAAGNEQGIDLQQAGNPEQDRVNDAGGGGGRRDHDLGDSGNPGGDDGHDQG